MNTGAKEIQSILEELEELKLSHMAIELQCSNRVDYSLLWF